MLVEAYAAGRIRTVQDEVPKITPDYRTAMYNSVLGSVNTPGAMEREKALEPGIHLHFILPDAFTHSEDAETYPAVPDRYIVTRIWYAKDTEKLALRCFIVDSSYITTDESCSGSVTIPFFGDGDMRKKWRYLGRSYPADRIPADQDDPSAHLERLTAVGAGEPLFAAYYPCCRSVFGFYDDLKDLPELYTGKLTYFVTGYFREKSRDPFSAVADCKEFTQLLEKNRFSAEPPQDFCNGCVLYGAADAVDWRGFDAEYCPAPEGRVSVAFGNNSAEALSCMIKNSLDGTYSVAERMLTALQYELYDEAGRTDGNFKIDDEIHRNTFSAVESFDEIPAISAAPDTLKKNGAWETYRRLRELGETVGRLRRSLAFAQNRLYGTWEQYVLLYEQGESTQDIPSKETVIQELERICGEIDGLKQEIERQSEDFERLWRELNGNGNEKGRLPEGAECKKSGEKFYMPKEPALLLGGPGIKRSFAFGEDGRFTSDGTLFCQTAPVTAERDNAEVLRLCFGELPDTEKLPFCYQELLLQTLLICPCLKQYADTLAGELSAAGAQPSPVAVNTEPLTWTTLYMIWGAQYMPTRTEADPDNTLDDWSFEYGQTSLTYQGGLQPEQIKKILIQGKILLTPHAVTSFKDAVRRYSDLYGEDKEIKELADQIGNFSIVSQNLDGFSDSFLGYQPALQFPLMGIGGDEELVDQVSAHIGRGRQSVVPESELRPLRGGYLKITDLSLVSTFGRRQTLIRSSYC